MPEEETGNSNDPSYSTVIGRGIAAAALEEVQRAATKVTTNEQMDSIISEHTIESAIGHTEIVGRSITQAALEQAREMEIQPVTRRNEEDTRSVPSKIVDR
jgi:hypothetical protein